MSELPCEQDARLRAQIMEFADTLKAEAHTLGDHGLSEREFYESGVFHGAIERIRGQAAATMRQKREFVRLALNRLQDEGTIRDWSSSGGANRHDYSVTMSDGWLVAVELKGCLDGNNTNIFERPPQAQEFVIWSICTNLVADPRHNLWSGVHTRLSAEIVEREQLVDGLVVWDWVCGTAARRCPKVASDRSRLVTLGPYQVPPPCLYLFPRTVPSVRSNPQPPPHQLHEVRFLAALHQCYGGKSPEINEVSISVSNKGSEVVRRTTISRGGAVQRESDDTPIRRR